MRRSLGVLKPETRPPADVVAPSVPWSSLSSSTTYSALEGGLGEA